MRSLPASKQISPFSSVSRLSFQARFSTNGQLHSSLHTGSDVGASLIRDKGILDTKAYEYEVSRVCYKPQAARLIDYGAESLRIQAQHE